MIKTAIFITVRTGSTRLPNKALLKIQGLTTIEYLIKRIKNSKRINCIVLCTTEKKEDDCLIEIANRNKILYFRGSEEDKLERWRGASEKYKIDFFITADGDDIFCDPYLIDLAYEQFKRNNSDFITGDGLITGSFTYGIKVNALKKVCEIKNTSNTEMMWVYFTDTGLFQVETLENVSSKFYRNDIRMTLDYEEDLEFFKEIVKRDTFKHSYLTLNSILEIVEKEPQLKKINYFRHKEWSLNQNKKTKLVLKDGHK